MVPLFIKETNPNSASSADISIASVYRPRKENTIFSLPLSLHIYSFQSEIR